MHHVRIEVNSEVFGLMGKKDLNKTEPSITLIKDPAAFFREQVVDALQAKSLSVSAETEFYLVNLLRQFITSDRLYRRDTEGHFSETPLALMVKEAFENQKEEEQKLIFQQIGDISLYMAGFFRENLTRKLVALDYYIEMGGQAYQKVAERANMGHSRKTFLELSNRFSECVEVISSVSEKSWGKTERDLLSLYEMWVRTGSERAARTLQNAGIVPQTHVKKTVQ